MRAVVYYAYNSGLTNRLRAMIGYQALAECLGIPFYLCWIPNQDCDEKFENLFVIAKINLISPDKLHSLENDDFNRIFVGNEWFDEIWSKHAEGKISKDNFFSHALDNLNDLQPVPKILQKVKFFAKTFQFLGCQYQR